MKGVILTMIWPFVSTVIITMITLLIFGGLLSKFETYITDKFSQATATRRWFTIWVLVFILWVAVHRQLLGHVSWYNEDVDLIVLTGLFSAVPYWVENSLKHGQAKFQEMLMKILDTNSKMLEHLTKLTQQVQTSLDIVDVQTDLITTLVEKLVDFHEEDKNG